MAQLRRMARRFCCCCWSGADLCKWWPGEVRDSLSERAIEVADWGPVGEPIGELHVIQCMQLRCLGVSTTKMCVLEWEKQAEGRGRQKHLGYR